MGTINIFLSSSIDLQNDRKDFEIFIGRERTVFAKKVTALELNRWEVFNDSMALEGLQAKYLKEVRNSDIFVMLYSLKVGKYTLEEFENAFAQFKKTGKPLILVYYKKELVYNQDWSESNIKSVEEFNELMSRLQHFTTKYENMAELCLHFRQQLDLYLDPPGPQIKNHNLPSPPHGNKLIGRRDYINQIMDAICNTHVVTIEGFSGIGKTSVALEIGHILLNNSEIKIIVDVNLHYIVWISGKDKPNQKLWFNDVLDTIAEVSDHSSYTQIAPDKFFLKKREIEKLLRSGSYNILLILDNYETFDDPALESWLRLLPKPNKVLITSQTELRDTWKVYLKSLKEDEAKELVLKYANEKGLLHLKSQDEEKLLSLVKITGCNPLAIKMAVGYIRGGDLTLEEVVEQLTTDNPAERMEEIFEKLNEASWNGIGKDAQDILLVTPLFVGVNSIHREALQAVSGLTKEAFESGKETLLKWKLLEINFDEARRYIIHPITRRFVATKLNERKEFEKDARRQ